MALTSYDQSHNVFDTNEQDDEHGFADAKVELRYPGYGVPLPPVQRKLVAYEDLPDPVQGWHSFPSGPFSTQSLVTRHFLISCPGIVLHVYAGRII